MKTKQLYIADQINNAHIKCCQINGRIHVHADLFTVQCHPNAISLTLAPHMPCMLLVDIKLAETFPAAACWLLPVTTYSERSRHWWEEGGQKVQRTHQQTHRHGNHNSYVQKSLLEGLCTVHNTNIYPLFYLQVVYIYPMRENDAQSEQSFCSE